MFGGAGAGILSHKYRRATAANRASGSDSRCRGETAGHPARPAELRAPGTAATLPWAGDVGGSRGGGATAAPPPTAAQGQPRGRAAAGPTRGPAPPPETPPRGPRPLPRPGPAPPRRQPLPCRPRGLGPGAALCRRRRGGRQRPDWGRGSCRAEGRGRGRGGRAAWRGAAQRAAPQSRGSCSRRRPRRCRRAPRASDEAPPPSRAAPGTPAAPRRRAACPPPSPLRRQDGTDGAGWGGTGPRARGGAGPT